MTWVAAAATAVSLGVQGVKAVKANKQKKDAIKLAANNRLEEYETPGQVSEATSIAEQQFLNGNPLEAAARRDISASSGTAYAQSVNAATSSNDLLDSISRIQKSENDALNNLASQSAAYNIQAGRDYQSALMREAGYADKEYQLNEYDPYMRTANTAAAMYGAGQVNEMSALDGMATTVMAAGNNPQIQQKLGNIKLFGKRKGQQIDNVLPGAEVVYNNGQTVNPIEAAAAQVRNYK